MMFSPSRRVQQLLKAIALRRLKSQDVGGRPLLHLPSRQVFVEHITLSEEERAVYDTMQKEGKLIVSKWVYILQALVTSARSQSLAVQSDNRTMYALL